MMYIHLNLDGSFSGRTSVSKTDNVSSILTPSAMLNVSFKQQKNMKQERGREYRRKKTFAKYISRLKEHQYLALIPLVEKPRSCYDWRKPLSYVDFKENSTWAKLLKNTSSLHKDVWRKFDKKHTNKQQRELKHIQINEGLIEWDERFDEDD